MNSMGLNTLPCDAYDLGMMTDSTFGTANILPGTYTKIRNSLSNISGIPVITGFIAKDKKGNITTLGRGGSDYTACIVGAAINAEEIQIWTNVNGIMTADPKIVKNAQNIKTISFEEESELEFLGANTLHPKGIQPAMKKNITVRILNTLQPKQKGTIITKSIREKKRIASITHKENISVINVYNPRMLTTKNFIREAFDVFRKHNLSVDIASASRAGVMVTLSGNQEIAKAVEDLKKIGRVKVRSNRAKVSVVGKSLSLIPGISGRILSSLDDIAIEAISCGSSDVSQSFVVKQEDAARAITLIHNKFFGRSK
jgi:aspartate kinase